MRFIKSDHEGIDLQAYGEYLAANARFMPPGARSYVSAEGRYEMHSHACLHDSWIERISIIERGEGERGATRPVEIEIVLLGAYHDGYHFLKYSGVKSYRGAIHKTIRVSALIGHGDWMVDEVVLMDDGSVKHEIMFAETGTWEIVCDDFSYFWQERPERLHA